MHTTYAPVCLYSKGHILMVVVEMPEIGNQIQQAVSVIVIVVALLAMTPVIVGQVQNMNTSAWNFTGYEGSILFLGLVPFIWVASILGCAAYAMFSIAKGKGKG